MIYAFLMLFKFNRCIKSIRLIRQNIVSYLFPDALATYQANERVNFGSLTAVPQAQGIHFGPTNPWIFPITGRIVPWHHFEGIDIDESRDLIVFRMPGTILGMRKSASISLGTVQNIDVFCLLVEHVKKVGNPSLVIAFRSTW